jgi:hypothetical protein
VGNSFHLRQVCGKLSGVEGAARAAERAMCCRRGGGAAGVCMCVCVCVCAGECNVNKRIKGGMDE